MVPVNALLALTSALPSVLRSSDFGPSWCALRRFSKTPLLKWERTAIYDPVPPPSGPFDRPLSFWLLLDKPGFLACGFQASQCFNGIHKRFLAESSLLVEARGKLILQLPHGHVPSPCWSAACVVCAACGKPLRNIQGPKSRARAQLCTPLTSVDVAVVDAYINQINAWCDQISSICHTIRN